MGCRIVIQMLFVGLTKYVDISFPIPPPLPEVIRTRAGKHALIVYYQRNNVLNRLIVLVNLKL